MCYLPVPTVESRSAAVQPHVLRGALSHWRFEGLPNGSPATLAVLQPKDHPLAKVVLDELGELQVRCSNKKIGCSWTGPRSDVQTHAELSCEHHKCSNCKEGCPWTGKKNVVDLHVRNDCQHHKCVHSASGCAWLGKQSAAAEHVASDCQAAPVPCTHAKDGCIAIIARGSLQAHIANDCIVPKQVEAAKQKAEREQRAKELRAKLDRLNPKEELLHLNIGGTHRVTTSRPTFGPPLCPADSLLALLFDPSVGDRQLSRTANGEIFIDRPGEAFVHLLDYLRTGALTSSLTSTQALLLAEEAEFWGVPLPKVQRQFTYTQEGLNKLLQQPIDFKFLGASFADLDFGIVSVCNRKWEFYDCDLSGAQLHGFQMLTAQRCQMREVQLPQDISFFLLRESDLTNVDMCHCHGSNVNFNKAKLQGVKLPANIQGWVFEGADLTDVDLRRCRATSVYFKNAKLQGAQLPAHTNGWNFQGADLTNVDLRHCGGNNVDLCWSKLQGVQLPVNIEGWNFQGADLTNVDLRHCQGNNVNCMEAKLQGIKLPAYIQGWTFQGADLTYVDLRHCQGNNVNFNQAKMQGVQIPGHSTGFSLFD